MSVDREPVVFRDIIVAPKESCYNFFRYNIQEKNKKYKICISCIKCSAPKFTAVFFDFKNQKPLHYEIFDTSKSVILTFVTGENLEEVALCIYAGVAGRTKGEMISIELESQKFSN